MTDSLISAARAEQGTYDTTYLETLDQPQLGSGASSDREEDAPNSQFNSNYGNKSQSPQSHSSLEENNSAPRQSSYGGSGSGSSVQSGRRHTSTGIADSGLNNESRRRRRSSEQRSDHTSGDSDEGGTSGSSRKRGGSRSSKKKKRQKKKSRTQSEPAVPNINPFETGGPSDDLLEDFFGLGTTTTTTTAQPTQPISNTTNSAQLQQQHSFDVAFDPNHDPFATTNDTNTAMDPLFDIFGLESTAATTKTTVTTTAPQLPTNTIPTPQSGRRGSRKIEAQLEPGAAEPGAAGNRKRRGSKRHKKKKKSRRRDDDSDESDHTSGESTHTSEHSSDSSSGSMSELSDEELQKHRNAYLTATGGAAPDAIPPPPRKQRSTNRGHKSRASAPAGDIGRDLDRMRSDESIPERQLGVNVGDKDTDRRVRTHIKDKDRDRQKSTDSNDASETKPPSKNAPKPPKTTTLHDVLPEIKRGTALLKYGRRGYPHFRQFNISADNRYLVWFSNKKKIDTSSINVKDIDEVITGQHTKEFRRISWTTLTPASFSIIYDGKKRSLNLVAKSVDEMKMWVQALRALRDKARKGDTLEGMRELKIEVDFRDRNRPQSRRHSGNFLRSHETKEREVDPILHRRLIDDLEALKKQFQELTLLTQNEVLRSTGDEWKSIEQILSELEERIEELEHEVINTRNTKIAENDVWRTRIDMEALKEKIKVLIKTNKKKYKQDKSRRWSVF